MLVNLVLFVQTLFAHVIPNEYVITLQGQSLPTEVKVLEQLSKGIFLVEQIGTRSEALRALSARPEVAIAEPNYIYQLLKTPNEGAFRELWGLHNTGQKDPNSNPGKRGIDINITPLWDRVTDSKNVVIAVIDSGIDTSHFDLKDNLWTNLKEATGVTGVDDDGNGYIDDIHGYDFVDNTGELKDLDHHGTHVAGTIGARGNNQKGLVGVNWQARLMGLRFLSRGSGGTLANAIRAIQYAIDNGAHVMNNSWGGGAFSQQLKDMIESANQKGIAFVAAAGNSIGNNDRHPLYPASYQVGNVISVAAVDNQGLRAKFTNTGKTSVHLAAPGVNVISTLPGNRFGTTSGTSMAAPHVTGVIALLLQLHPATKPDIIRDVLVQTSKPLPSLQNRILSGGIIDANAAAIQLDVD